MGLFSFIAYLPVLFRIFSVNDVTLQKILLVAMIQVIITSLYLFHDKLEKRVIKSILVFILFLVSLPLLIIGVIMNLLVYFNYPPSEEIIADFPVAIEQEKIKAKEEGLNIEADEMLREFRNQYEIYKLDLEKKLIEDKEELERLLAKTEADRKELIRLLAKPPLNLPNRTYGIRDLFNLEIIGIKKNLEAENLAVALTNYNMLWLVANNFIGSEKITEHLLGVLLIENLIELYFTYSNLIQAENISWQIVSQIKKNHTLGYQRYLKNDYYEFIAIIEKIEEAASEGKAVKYLASWPIIDFNYLKKEVYKYYQAVINRVKTPYYKWESEADLLEQYMYPLRDNRKDFLENPASKFILAFDLTSFEQLTYKHAQTESRLKIFSYAMNNGELPIDPLTGEEFNLEKDHDQLIISSNYKNEAGEKIIRYKKSPK